MPKISQLLVDKRLSIYTTNLLWNSLTLTENKGEVISFLKDLLTPTELRMLAKRITIAKMLLERYDYQTIRNHLKVSDPTISTINSKIKYSEGGLLTVLKRIFEIEFKRKEKLKGRIDILKPPPGGIDIREVIKLIDSQIKKQAKRRSVEKNLY